QPQAIEGGFGVELLEYVVAREIRNTDDDVPAEFPEPFSQLCVGLGGEGLDFVQGRGDEARPVWPVLPCHGVAAPIRFVTTQGLNGLLCSVLMLLAYVDEPAGYCSSSRHGRRHQMRAAAATLTAFEVAVRG